MFIMTNPERESVDFRTTECIIDDTIPNPDLLNDRYDSHTYASPYTNFTSKQHMPLSRNWKPNFDDEPHSYNMARSLMARLME